jgi:hypothetical protein
LQSPGVHFEAKISTSHPEFKISVDITQVMKNYIFKKPSDDADTNVEITLWETVKLNAQRVFFLSKKIN